MRRGRRVDAGERDTQLHKRAERVSEGEVVASEAKGWRDGRTEGASEWI